jgi:hypothetical protein
MKTTHIIITPKKKIWVAENASDADALRLQGNTAKVLFCNMPCELKKFFRENPEERSLFTKAFAYWIRVKAKNQKEIQKKYGTLKQKLSEFSEELLQTVKNIATLIAKKIKKFWYYQNKKQRIAKRMSYYYNFK